MERSTIRSLDRPSYLVSCLAAGCDWRGRLAQRTTGSS